MTTTSNLSPVQVLRPDSASRKRTETSRELPARRRSSRLLAPFPEGWYLVASRRAGERATLLSKTSMGKVIVVWCDDQGTIGVADARCPHCGSHLGRQAGGRVRAGRLACACRGFEFDISGGRTAMPSASPPRQAGLGVLETRELAGLVFAWYGVDGREPQWRLPHDPPDQDGWSRPLMRTVRFPGHPQETSENAVDLAHLSYVHGFDEVQQVGAVAVDGPTLRTAFDFTQRVGFAGLPIVSFDVSAHVTALGLGYSFIEVDERSIGMQTRLWTLATPVDGTLIDLTLVSQVRQIRHPRRRIVGLAFLTTTLRTQLMNQFVLAQELLGVS